MEDRLSEGKAGNRKMRRLKEKHMRRMMSYVRKMVPTTQKKKKKGIHETLRK